MIRLAICDDDTINLNENKHLVQNTLNRNSVPAELEIYDNGPSLLYEVQDGTFFDLVLLDIEMPQITGMELAARLRELLPEVLIIFITSHLKYAIDSFELAIFRYIPKDNLTEKLPSALRDAITLIELQKDLSYTVITKNRLEKIPYKKILYIQRDGNNSLFYTEQGKTKVRKALAKVYKELQPDEFIYIDKGCIANLAQISQIKDKEVLLLKGTRLPISRSRLAEVKLALNTYWGSRL